MTSESPNSWQRCRLGDAINLKRGYDLPQRDRRPGLVPIVSSSGSSGWHDTAKVRAPGVVTGRYGTIGQVFFVEEDFWPLNTALYVQDFKGNDPAFIALLLRTLNWRAHEGKSGVPGINRNDVHSDPVSLPPIAEQRAIASVFGALDNKVDSNRRLAVLSENVWLTEARRLWAEAEVIPVSELRAQDVLEIGDGYRAKNSELGAGGLPFLRAGNLTGSGIDTSKADRAPSELVSRAGNKVSRDWDTAFTSKGTVGRITLVDPSAERCVYSPQICFWRSLDRQRISPFVLHAWMRSARFRRQIDAVKGQTDMADYVSLRDQRSMFLDLPSATAQAGLDALAKPLALASASLRAETRTLTALQGELLPKLVSGQIRVPVSRDPEESLGAAVAQREVAA